MAMDCGLMLPSTSDLVDRQNTGVSRATTVATDHSETRSDPQPAPEARQRGYPRANWRKPNQESPYKRQAIVPIGTASCGVSPALTGGSAGRGTPPISIKRITPWNVSKQNQKDQKFSKGLIFDRDLDIGVSQA
jgi:hypothetical protein